MRRGLTNTGRMWLGSALLCLVSSFVAGSEPTSAEQLASDALRAGKSRDKSAVRSLTESLSHESVLVRQSSAWALSQLGESAIDAVPSLTHALGDLDPRVRWASAVALGRIGRKAANSESALWQTTRDRDCDVRCAALIALRVVSVSKPSGALSALIECLRNPSSDVQAETIATVTAIHARWDDDEKRPVAIQLASILELSDDDLRLAAAVLLGDFGLAASAAIAELAAATDDAEPHLQAAALRAVTRFADAVDQSWNRMSVEQRRELRPGLIAANNILDGRRQKSADIAQLADQYQRLIDGTQLISTDRSSSLQRAAVPLIKPASEISKEAPRTASTSPSTPSQNWLWVCGALLMCVGAWGLWHGLSGVSLRMSPAKTHLVEIPQTPQEPVADSIVYPLPGRSVEDSGHGAIDAVPQLISALLDEDSRVRATAALVLAALGAQWQEIDSSVETNSSAVPDSPPLAISAVEQAEATSTEEIVRLVSDPVVSVRSNIASALGGIGTDTADASITATPSADVDPSTAAPHQDSPVLRLFSPDHEDELTVPEVAEQPLEAADFIAQLEDADGNVRWSALQALQELGASAVPELMASLNHRNPAVRKSVIVALGQIGGEARSAMPAMLVALHDVNADVRGAAADCLGRLGVVNRSMLQTLVRTLSDPNAEVRRYAATTLGRVGPQARAAITALQIASISDIAIKVRSAAQAALQRISKPQVEAA